MAVNIASRLETGTPFLKNLIADINSGEIKIPQFQRKFIWKEVRLTPIFGPPP